MRIIRFTFLVLFITFLGIRVSYSAPYTFEIVAETGKGFSEFGNDASISCNGTVAFTAASDGRAGVYKSNGQKVDVIHESTAPLASYSTPSINDSGSVVFRLNPDGRPYNKGQLRIDDGASNSIIVDGENDYGRTPSINNVGQVAYSGSHDTRGVFANDGHRIVRIASLGSTVLGAFGDRVSINDNGDVAFSARLAGNKHAIVVGDGVNLRLIADSDGELSRFWTPAMNNAGQLIFHAARPVASQNPTATEPVIAFWDGRKLEIVADSSGDLVFFDSRVSINSKGDYVFAAMLRGKMEVGRGIFTGPDSIADKVVMPGDLVGGRTIKTLNLGWSAMNDTGQIVLRTDFDDGTQAIIVAQPANRVASDCSAPVPRRLLVESDHVDVPFTIDTAVKPSRWIEAEKLRYAELLSAAAYDAIVVPFQPDGHTLDPPGRTMLARIVADQLAEATGMRVADPGLVEKALGAPARFVKPDDAFELGRKLGVELVVLGRVGHDREFRMTIEVDTYRDTAGGVSGASAHLSEKWHDVPFSDEKPPMMAFEAIAAELIAKISGKAYVPKPLPEPPQLDSDGIPATWDQLVSRAESSRLDAALQLQFLAGLFFSENMSRSREHLYERSLVAVRNLPAASPGLKLIRARALMGLNRRPAALATLAMPVTDAEFAFLAFLNGDLPSLERSWKKIDDPVLRLLAEIDLQTVRTSYGLPHRFERIHDAASEYHGWFGFIVQRIAGRNDGSVESHVLTKTALDRIGPPGNISAEEIVNAGFVTGEFPSELTLVGNILNHVTNTYSGARKVAIIEPYDSNIPYLDDILQLTVDVTVANVLSEARIQSERFGKPAEALKKLAKYDALFADHPVLMLEKSANVGLVGQSSIGNERGVRYLSQAFVWLGRQTRADSKVIYNPKRIFPELLDGSADFRYAQLYVFEFPGRADRNLRIAVDPEAARSQFEHCRRYTQFRVECFSSPAHQTTYLTDGQTLDKPADVSDSSKALAKELEYRFLGHPKRLQILSSLALDYGEPNDEKELLEVAVEHGAGDWFAYESLGTRKMRDGLYIEASNTFLAYPAFNDTSLANPITLSNRAYEAGSLLYWVGAYEEARPLYEISAGLRTGSAASLSSKIRLAILDGDLEQATEISLQRARRYNDIFAYRDYMAFLHLNGRSEDSWTLFAALMQNDAVSGPQLWTSAYLGHRINGATDQDIRAWALDPKHNFQAAQGNLDLPLRYVFLMNVTDRLPPVDMESTFRQLQPELGNKASLQAIRFRDELTGVETIFLSEQQRTAIAARGLAFFHRGQFEQAFAAFEQIGETTDFREFLPYYVWSAVQTRQTDRLDKILEWTAAMAEHGEGNSHTGYEFDALLARALIAGAGGKHEDAADLLRRALNHRPFTVNRKIFAFYQLLEMADVLFTHTGNDVYRALGFELAHRFTVIQPMYPWAYSFAARFANSTEQRIPYLATALHLDAGSWRANNASQEDKDLARKWLSIHGPLYKRKVTESRSL